MTAITPTVTSALVAQNLSKHFGGIRAMTDVSLMVQPGERLSIIGTNGAGKSTFFNTVAGIYPPTGGRIEFFGQDVTKLRTPERANLGLARTFQTSTLFDTLTVADNVYLSLKHKSGLLARAHRASSRWDKVEQVLRQVGLLKEATTEVSQLSHGEQRQLEIAMALASEPKILMLDEPAAGFSATERSHLLEILRSLPEEITLVLIEHDMDIALAVADRVVVMHDGEKVLEGTPDEIRESELVREIYLGGDLDE